MMPDKHVQWEGGGHAAVATLDGESIALRSTRSFAPGSRPAGTVPGGSELRIKTHRSKRLDAESFLVEGRVLDLTRNLRVALERLLGKSGDEAPAAADDNADDVSQA